MTHNLIDGKELNEDTIRAYFTNHLKGECLLAVGDENLIKTHVHTNEPCNVLADVLHLAW